MLFSESVVRHSKLLYNSFAAVTGQALLDNAATLTADELAQQLYAAPFVLLSHGTQPEPIFNYANQTAQNLWEMNWEQFTQLPSRRSAEPVAEAEREAMLAEARKKGYISDYNGVRISSTGKRFIIKNAVLWNIYDESNTYYGQAATFKEWEVL